MTKEQAIVTALAVLTGTFRVEVSETMAEGYRMGLEGLTPDEIGAAVAAALRECKFMPAPAELRKLARPPRNLALEAATAWTAVRRAVSTVDYTVASIDFGPHVNAVIRQLGGWDALCRASLTDLDVWKRKEFERLYGALVEAPIGDIGGALAGAWKTGHAVIAIRGIPSQPSRALPEVGSDDGVRNLIRELADAKEVR